MQQIALLLGSAPAHPQGMSYTEFTYQLLQAYDFSYLFEKHNVAVQARVAIHRLSRGSVFPCKLP